MKTCTEWNREGQVVKGLYLGYYPVSGLVISSRVKYGGVVQHSINLNHDLETYGTVRTAGTILLLDENEIISE